MDLLPEPDECEHLLDELALLIVAAGSETFLASPIVPASARAFPDRWHGDAASVRRLLQRLLAYGGLAELEVSLEIDHYAEVKRELDAHGHQRVTGHEGVAGWFAGIERRVCYFSVDLQQLEDPEALVGTLAHEVCHAYRRWLDIETSDRDLEERRTDLTSIYLGFGILTANAALRFRSGTTENLGSYWRSAQGGYLAPQSMCYLLAAQVVARGLDAKARAAIARELETNQAASFRAACDALAKADGGRAALLERLGLPVAALHPPVRELPEIPTEERPAPRIVASAPAASGGPSDDSPTFRLARRGGTSAGLFGGLIAAAIAAAILVTFDQIAAAIVAGFVGPIGGSIVTRRTYDACAFGDCRATLPQDVLRCPACRRPVVGRVDSEADRLDAEEAWRKRRKRA